MPDPKPKPKGQATDQPEDKGFFQQLYERWFPPAALGGVIQDSIKKTRPPQSRRPPTKGTPIEKMKPRASNDTDNDGDSGYDSDSDYA